MSSILTGIFENENNYKNFEKDLENSGIPKSQYIVYLNDNNKSAFAASVQVSDDAEAERASEIFNKNDVTKTHLFTGMTIQEASNYEELKKRIEVISLAEIPETPDVKIKGTDSGIDTQVKF